MIVKSIIRSSKKIEEMEYKNAIEICVNGKLKLRFADGEPEDATLSRGFNDVYYITDALEMAYSAGKSGEQMIIKYEESDNV